MKTVGDYMNDPRMLSDPDMAGALEPIKELHAIRWKLQDERAGMSAPEEVEYLNGRARAFLEKIGRPDLLVNLSGQGRVQYRP
jgi:hypothetical protein